MVTKWLLHLETSRLPMFWHGAKGKMRHASLFCLFYQKSKKKKISKGPRRERFSYISFVRAVSIPGRKWVVGRGLGLEIRQVSPQCRTHSLVPVLHCSFPPTLATTVPSHLNTGRERLGVDPRCACGYCSFKTVSSLAAS